VIQVEVYRNFNDFPPTTYQTSQILLQGGFADFYSSYATIQPRDPQPSKSMSNRANVLNGRFKNEMFKFNVSNDFGSVDASKLDIYAVLSSYIVCHHSVSDETPAAIRLEMKTRNATKSLFLWV
jgi:hypothetical protein